MTDRVCVGVVGYGYWGPNLARNFHSNSATELRVICDLSPERRAAASRDYPGVKVTDNFEEILSDPSINAVAIATPTASHFLLARASLEAGKHTFVEKPITDSAAAADELVRIAEASRLTLHVDHTFVYTNAVDWLEGAVSRGDLGDLWYFDSTRVALGLFQPDVNVLWDLAVHDLSILQYVTKKQPIAVSATGVFHPQASQACAAFLTVSYEDLFVAHIDVSWMSPVKIRRTLISGSSKMAVFDDLETVEKIKVFDAGIDIPETADDLREVLVSYRTGDMMSPRLRDTEALSTEVSHFANCVRTGLRSRTDGALGAALVRVLEAASASLEQGGAPISLATLGEAT